MFIRKCLFVLAALLICTNLAPNGLFNQTAEAATNYVKNPGFEANGATQTPDGWTTWANAGNSDADYTESGGHAGTYRLTHYKSTAYQVNSYQTITGLSNGIYTLYAWVKSGGGQKENWISASGYGGDIEMKAPIPATNNWTIVQVTGIVVTNGQLTVNFWTDANAGNWSSIDDVGLYQGMPFLKGADVSNLPLIEAGGGKFYDQDVQKDCLQILKDHGINFIRIKVWNNPQPPTQYAGFSDKNSALALAKRVKSLGMGLSIDFHYSDTWADPGHQTKPADWADLSFANLQASLYNFTYQTVSELKKQGTTPVMVQVGNEITNGMLWPDGSTSNWPNLAALLKQGYNAVKTASGLTQVMIHLDTGGDNSRSAAWFANAVNNGVKFDAIGLSYYPQWQGSLDALQGNINDLVSRYGKPVYVVETAYPWTWQNFDSETNSVTDTGPVAYPATVAGQKSFLNDLLSRVSGSSSKSKGTGVFYWEPEWIAVNGAGWEYGKGDGWDNVTLFDNNGNVLDSVNAFLSY